MMCSKTFFSLSLLTMTLFLVSPAGWATEGGHEILNGGSIVVDGSLFDLADLHFVPTSHESFQFDDELSGALSKLQKLLKDLEVEVATEGCTAYRWCEKSELFADFVFDPVVEYRFVSSLPALCHSRFPSGEILRIEEKISCTSGSVTYVVPARFVGRSLEEKALLILGERLETMFPTETADLKKNLLRQLQLLFRLAHKKASSRADVFTPSELKTLDGFTANLELILGTPLDFRLVFAADGGSRKISTLPPGVIRLPRR